VLENGSNPKPKVLQSLGQNFKIIWSLGPESQIVLLHNSISSLVKGGIAPKKLLPKYLHIFNFQYFCSTLGTLHDISTTMREKEKSRKHAFRCNNIASMADETLRNPTCKYPRSKT
jgi:aminoglycoside phosphotransferase (APT) family kinase protein